MEPSQFLWIIVLFLGALFYLKYRSNEGEREEMIEMHSACVKKSIIYLKNYNLPIPHGYEFTELHLIAERNKEHTYYFTLQSKLDWQEGGGNDFYAPKGTQIVNHYTIYFNNKWRIVNHKIH